MGVPKFFRWISERYPKINQPFHAPPNEETKSQYFPCSTTATSETTSSSISHFHKQDDKVYIQKNNILPEFDRLYLDMNGIIHCCSHNNSSDDIHEVIQDSLDDPPTSNLTTNNDSSPAPGSVQISEAEIFRNVCYYVDRVVTDIAKPKELVYMAIDGVAPRAKMNQQRSRRYRSGKEKEIESTFQAAHLLAQKKRREMMEEQAKVASSSSFSDAYLYHDHDDSTSYDYAPRNHSSPKLEDPSVKLEEVEPGRFSGMFQTGPESSSRSNSSGSSSSSDATSASSKGVTSSSSSLKHTKSSNDFDLDYDEFCKTMTSSSLSNNKNDPRNQDFHSNQITPGTEFFERCTAHLRHFIQRKLHTDPRWAHLTVIFSGPDVPGEGEHKIMQFIREQKAREDYNPNTRHCLFGQDGDLIMLGLASHEPHFVLLREEVVFEQARKKEKERRSAEAVSSSNALSLTDDTGMVVNNERLSASIDSYIHNANFELLHMSILRDYLAFEFETRDILPTSQFDLEQTIDDFVFMTFIVGNDFLPHMPAIDIADEAFDLIFYTYKKNRKKWLKEEELNASLGRTPHPYLTNAGEIVSGSRLERFLTDLGKHEDPYYSNKKKSEDLEIKRQRKSDKKYGRESTVPSDEILAAKKEWDRTNYMEMLMSISKTDNPVNGFQPVSSSKVLLNDIEEKKQSRFISDEEQDELEEGFLNRMGKLIRNSLSPSGEATNSTTYGSYFDQNLSIDHVSEDLKGRYYYEKFHFSPLDAEQHIALRKAYIEGLVWNLKYYYKGCVCWDWFYPYHYGPMLSDLKDIETLLDTISFENNKSEPLQPFEQLMACLPPSSAELLPKPYQWLMKSPKSPIIDFYPDSFTVDMNGKRWPWEAVVLLPFIDSKRLITSSREYVPMESLTDDEKRRNQLGDAVVYTKAETPILNLSALSDRPNFGSIEGCQVVEANVNETPWKYTKKSPSFRPELLSGVQLPYPGFPTLRDAPVYSMSKRKLGINVFGLRSRYKTAVLKLDHDIPSVRSALSISNKFIGSTLYFRYPFLQEGFVTAVSDSSITVRGTDAPRPWTSKEAQTWRLKKDAIQRQYETGDGLTGSGGWNVPDSEVTLSLRPLKEIQTLPDGSKVKIYARLEVDVPLAAAIWQPSAIDPRLIGIPARLEKNPYRFGSEPMKPFFTVPDSRVVKKNSFSLSNNPSKSKILPDFSVGVPTKSSILPPIKNEFLGSSTRFSTFTARVNEKKYPRESFSMLHRKVLRRSFGSKSLAITIAVVGAIFADTAHAKKLIYPVTSLPKIQHDVLHRLAGGSFESNTQKDLDYGFETKSAPPLEFAHGTTTLSFIFKDGIVAAVDSRASIGTFVGSKTTQKVLPVSDHILGTMAGGAADCSFWIRKLQAEAQRCEIAEEKAISVSRVSRLLADYLYANRHLNLSVGTMIMGVDEFGPSIYYVDNTGTRIKGDMFSVGSGSTFALGVLDTNRRADMNEEEAVSLAIKAIRHATFRDAYSGGYIAVYVITPDGFKKVFSEDLPLMK